MAYLTEAKIGTVLDLPVCIPATELQMGDWIIFASVKVIEPMRLTFKMLNLQLHSASVDIGDIDTSNKIFGNLGLAYVALRRDYSSGSPGITGALDVVVVDEIELVARDITNVVTLDTPGLYSWIIANNMQPSSDSDISTSTSIDFRVSATGQVRIELDSA